MDGSTLVLLQLWQWQLSGPASKLVKCRPSHGATDLLVAISLSSLSISMPSINNPQSLLIAISLSRGSLGRNEVERATSVYACAASLPSTIFTAFSLPAA